MQKKFNLALLNLSDESNEPSGGESDYRMKFLKNVIKNTSNIRDQVALVKLPSSIIENNKRFKQFAENLHLLFNCGLKIVIVHDFAEIIEQKIKDFDLHSNFQVTSFNSQKTIQLCEMILTGHINKMIVSKLNSFGVNAIGISGKDSQLIISKTTRQLKSTNDTNNFFVSEPLLVFPEVLLELGSTTLVPIISPVACDKNGSTTIVEIDKMMAMIAVAIGADHLLFLEKDFLYEKEVKRVSQKEELAGFKDHRINKKCIAASAYALDHSQIIVHFVNATTEDALIKCMIM